MFERFTDRARQVVVLAQEEARAFKHGYIGTEHILLGLLRKEEGVAAQVLAALGVTVEEARTRVIQLVGEGDEAMAGQIPFSPRAKKVLELALREAISTGHDYIGTEHILLGLARENEGAAATILLDFDAEPERIREEIGKVLGYNVESSGRPRRWRRPRQMVGSVGMHNCWQYRVERHETIDEQRLNDLGAEGWELVGIDRSGSGVELVFKRRGPMPGSLRAAG